MATNTFDFEEFEQWADIAEADGDDLAEFFTIGRD